MSVTNATFAGNTAAQGGQAIYSLSHETANAITEANASVTLTNTILAGANALAAEKRSGSSSTSSITYVGPNVIPSTTILTGGATLSGTSPSTANPLLSALGNYGGPTQTFALLPGSPAIDASNSAEVQTITVSGATGSFTLTFNGQTSGPLPFNATATQVQTALNALSSIGGVGGSVAVTQSGGVSTVTFGGALGVGDQPQISATGAGGVTAGTATVRNGSSGGPDQRGTARVNAADLGAFESRGFAIAVGSGSGKSTAASTAFAAPLVATVTANGTGEPVDGGQVTFIPPGSGASATLTGSPATIAAGTASVTATANATGGAYAVTATATGVATAASFNLTNLTTAVASIARTTPSAQFTNAGSVTYTVTFADATLGLTASNFDLTGTAGIADTNIGTPTTSDGGLTWSVPVTGLSGTDGTLVLNLVNNAGLDHAATNLSFAGESYTLDHTAPTTAFDSTPTATTSNRTPTFTFSGTDVGGSGVSYYEVKVDSGGFATQTSPFTTGTLADGSHTVQVRAVDNVGNADGSPASYTFVVDNGKPVATIGAPSRSFAKTGGSVAYTVTYNDVTTPTITLTAANVTLNKTGTANGTVQVSGTGSTRTVTITNLTGNGTLGISIKAGTAVDQVGLVAAAAGPSATFVVDNVAPVVKIGAPTVTSGYFIYAMSVDYVVTITDVNTASPLLATDVSVVSNSGTTTATVTVTKLDATHFKVSVTNVSAADAVGISIRAGSVTDGAGNTSAGPILSTKLLMIPSGTTRT